MAIYGTLVNKTAASRLYLKEPISLDNLDLNTPDADNLDINNLSF